MRILLNILKVVLLTCILSGCVAYGEAYIPAPPPLREEVAGVAPYPEALWVPGYWEWHRRSRGYRWHDGQWKRH